MSVELPAASNMDQVAEEEQSSAGAEDRSMCVCHATKAAPMTEERFFQLEALGTVIEPRCGSCQCTKCPVPGSQDSFKEQKELDIIQNNLKYNLAERRWYTEYPSENDCLPVPPLFGASPFSGPGTSAVKSKTW